MSAALGWQNGAKLFMAGNNDAVGDTILIEFDGHAAPTTCDAR